MKGPFEMVGDFHRKFGLPAREAKVCPRLMDDSVRDFRLGFLEEELAELREAHARGDLPGVADALVDLVYVALGTAHLCGIPFDEVFREVHRANMEKVRAASAEESSARTGRGHSLDVVKPAGWSPPDVEGVIASACREGLSGSPTDWDSRLYSLASEVSTWSKDPSTKVGAVLAGADPRRIALGYNGFPRWVRDLPERLGDREARLKLTQHAERNVLDNAEFCADGGSLYVTFFPCSECAKSIVSRGVRKVVCPPESDREPWAEDARWAGLVLSEGGVTLRRVWVGAGGRCQDA